MEFEPESPKDIRPIFAFLPEKIHDPEAVDDSLSDVSAWHVSANFVIVNFKGTVKAGDLRKFESNSRDS